MAVACPGAGRPEPCQAGQVLAPRTAALLLTAVLGAGCASVEAAGPVPSRPPAATSPAAPGPAAPSPAASPTPAVTPAPSRPSPSPSPVVVQRGSGTFTVVPGASAVWGRGPLRTYSVELEGGLGVDPRSVALEVDRTLADPRSWTAGSRRSMRRVSGPADIRITLASPATVDRLCAPLRTVGRWSCATGDRAVLNVARWLTGVPSFAGHLPDYRRYLVNHEVGHVLGFQHVRCPGKGRTAPVMLQQSISLDGCTRGPWPYP